jgi:hypothetical protein
VAALPAQRVTQNHLPRGVASSLSTPCPGTDVLSRSIVRGTVVTPEPVVAGPLIVPRSGMPLVFPLSAADDGSVGEGADGLTPGPDVLAGAAEL